MRHELTDADLVARGYAVTHPSGAIVLPTEPGWHELIFASSGVMRVETGSAVWVLPPHRALWLPDGARARIVMHGRVMVRTLYLRGAALLGQRTVAVDVPPLLRELILHAVRSCPLERDRPEHRRVVDMIGDLLAVAPQAPLLLPGPTDPRARALAAALETDLAAGASLERLAAAVGASRRTLERLFRTETGMSIGQWRQRLRLARALELLAAGQPVTAVASAVGYATPSAFTAMFRAQLGEPPRVHLRA
ncbi:AraC family transcriptional regulator [Pseudonocardia sp. GCM10023141]|uniref:AraC family transcriptional regulator n=1 Tax=Pseudonocardia sp. GCM10023141 TaxID=3252653 RepID=UPI003623988F